MSDPRPWQRIGTNRDVSRVPQWVISAFASMPGSHGTRLIDYPEPGMSVQFKGKTYRYRIDMGKQSWEVHRRLRKRAVEGPSNEKRLRATVIAEQGGRFLLVRERDARRYSLPGGGIERGESVIEAALRELREETKLAVVKAERLFDYEGTTQNHRVVWALVKGRVQIQRKELSDFRWWDGNESVQILDSASAIVRKLTSETRGRNG